MRGEIYASIESFRREIEASQRADADVRARIESKLDQLLNGKTEDARAMGAIQEQIRTLFVSVRDQGAEIAAFRTKLVEAREAPKDSLLRIAGELGKLLVAGLVGYFLHRGRP
jgi:hypothetical protein